MTDLFFPNSHTSKVQLQIKIPNTVLKIMNHIMPVKTQEAALLLGAISVSANDKSGLKPDSDLCSENLLDIKLSFLFKSEKLVYKSTVTLWLYQTIID